MSVFKCLINARKAKTEHPGLQGHRILAQVTATSGSAALRLLNRTQGDASRLAPFRFALGYPVSAFQAENPWYSTLINAQPSN